MKPEDITLEKNLLSFFIKLPSNTFKVWEIFKKERGEDLPRNVVSSENSFLFDLGYASVNFNFRGKEEYFCFRFSFEYYNNIKEINLETKKFLDDFFEFKKEKDENIKKIKEWEFNYGT